MRRPVDRQLQADINLSMIVGAAIVGRVMGRCLYLPKPNTLRHDNDNTAGSTPPAAA